MIISYFKIVKRIMVYIIFSFNHNSLRNHNHPLSLSKKEKKSMNWMKNKTEKERKYI
jgi:hypothetical protein